MAFWEIAAGASLLFSLYSAWPELVAGPARRAARAFRHADAMAAFGRGARFIPAGNRLARARMLLSASHAALDAGLPTQAVSWAEQTLALESRFPVLTLLAHSAAVRGGADAGEPWEADRHLTTARDLAEKYGRYKPIQVIAAGLLAQAAEAERRRGDLRRAIDDATGAIERGPEARRDACVVLAECAAVQGRFDDALRWFDTARSGPPFGDAWAETRLQGTLSLRVATTLLDAGRAAEVPPFLDAAYLALGRDPRLRLWCDATALRLRALDGDFDAIRGEAARLTAIADGLTEDRVTRLLLLSAFAESLLTVRKHDDALAAYDREEVAGLDPVGEARHWYGVGVCRRALGDTPGAVSAFRRANSRNLDVFHGALARTALADALTEMSHPRAAANAAAA